MKWLLDADVLSQPAKRNGNPSVLAWLAKEEPDCYTSAVVIGQLALWVRTKKGEPRNKLQTWLRRLINAFEGKIIGYNVAVAHVWAEQQAALEATGKRMPIEDSFIAATARRHNLTIATGNDKDYRGPGLKVFNPFNEPPIIGDMGHK